MPNHTVLCRLRLMPLLLIWLLASLRFQNARSSIVTCMILPHAYRTVQRPYFVDRVVILAAYRMESGITLGSQRCLRSLTRTFALGRTKSSYFEKQKRTKA